jgi:hypothetical protein
MLIKECRDSRDATSILVRHLVELLAAMRLHAESNITSPANHLHSAHYRSRLRVSLNVDRHIADAQSIDVSRLNDAQRPRFGS